MQALVWEGPRQMNLREVAEPNLEPDEVLIRVSVSGICGSELGGYLGHNSLRKPPLIMGHEFSGEIVALGERAGAIKSELAVGDRVTVNPLIHNPRSHGSLNGRPNLSRDRRIIGIHRPGSYAEYVTAPVSNTHKLPSGMSLEMAALTEPMGCAIRAARLAGATATSSALVTGLGPIGLLVAQVLKANGVRRLVTTDTDPDRRGIAAALGINAIDPVAENVVEIVRAATGGDGVDAAVDAVGADSTRRDCIQSVAWGGRVVFTGLHAEESPLPANYIIRSEITIQGSFAYTPLDFADALEWLAEGRITIEPWLVRAPLAEGGACFERLLSRPGPVAKILLES